MVTLYFKMNLEFYNLTQVQRIYKLTSGNFQFFCPLGTHFDSKFRYYQTLELHKLVKAISPTQASLEPNGFSDRHNTSCRNESFCFCSALIVGIVQDPVANGIGTINLPPGNMISFKGFIELFAFRSGRIKRGCLLPINTELFTSIKHTVGKYVYF